MQRRWALVILGLLVAVARGACGPSPLVYGQDVGTVRATATTNHGDTVHVPQAVPSPGTRSPAEPVASLPLVNMQEAGARGDGITDNSEIIKRIIDTAPAGTTFYFPAGIYQILHITIENRAHLRLTGDGKRTVLRWKGAAQPQHILPMMTFDKVTDLVIDNLMWDNRAVYHYGGVRFYNTKRVLIQHTSFVDSAPRPLRASNLPLGQVTDRYAYVFARGDVPHEDVRILDNAIEHLQMEVDYARRVEIRNNIVTGATATAGIGLFTLGDEAVMEDYVIAGNVVIDPKEPAAGFAIMLDPNRDSRCAFRNIRVMHNTVIRQSTGGKGLTVGTGYLPQSTRENRFEDLTIAGNLFVTYPTAPEQGEAFDILSNGHFVFDRLQVLDNLVIGNHRLRVDSNGSFDLRYPRDALIARNVFRRSATGILFQSAQKTEVSRNVVEASQVAYANRHSAGNNVFQGNAYLGTPFRLIENVDFPQASDRQEPPVLSPRDPTPPALTAIRAAEVTARTAVIRWQTSVPASSEVQYGTGGSLGETTYPRATWTVMHASKLTNLQPQTRYAFRVRSYDQMGNEAVSDPLAFTTPADASTPEPPPPARLRLTDGKVSPP